MRYMNYLKIDKTRQGQDKTRQDDKTRTRQDMKTKQRQNKDKTKTKQRQDIKEKSVFGRGKGTDQISENKTSSVGGE